MLRRKVEEIGSFDLRSTFPAAVGREQAVAGAVQGSPGGDEGLVGRVAGGVAELQVSTEHPDEDISGGSGLFAGVDERPSLIRVISESCTTSLSSNPLSTGPNAGENPCC